MHHTPHMLAATSTIALLSACKQVPTLIVAFNKSDRLYPGNAIIASVIFGLKPLLKCINTHGLLSPLTLSTATFLNIL